jgi:hypothetical protein
MKSREDTLPVEFENREINVDARLLGKSLDLDPSTVLARIKDGAITSLCEQGIGNDAGRYRLTFFHKNRRCQIVVDRKGKVIRRSSLDFGDRSLPASARMKQAFSDRRK